MKKVLYIILYTLLFIGCAPVVEKTVVYPPEKNVVNEKVIIKPIEPILEEKITEVKEEEPIVIEKPVVNDNKLAIIFPSSIIGKYALEATNTINTYLLYKNEQVTLTVLDMITQTEDNILKVMTNLKNKEIKHVIAMITKEHLSILNNIENINEFKIYLPLINKSEIEDFGQLANLNITFGAISYQDQFDKLIEYSNSASFVELYDNTPIGKTLHNYLKSNDIKYTKRVDDNNGRYKNFLKDNKKLNNSTIILNTPIVKSSILLSAITVHELNIEKIISTQLNYTPLLFSLTQKQDRKKLIIANSIGKIKNDLLEYNQLIGNNILYSWVNYSSMIGVEYLLNGNIDFFSDLSLEDNQVIYPVNLYKVGDNSFELIK